MDVDEEVDLTYKNFEENTNSRFENLMECKQKR